jgi:hypothetical protein
MAKPHCMHLMPMKPSATLEVGSKGGGIEFKMADGDHFLGELGLRKPELPAADRKKRLRPPCQIDERYLHMHQTDICMTRIRSPQRRRYGVRK